MNSMPSVMTGTMTARGVSRCASRARSRDARRAASCRSAASRTGGRPIGQALRVVRVVDEDRRPIGQRDERDRGCRSPSWRRTSRGRSRKNVISSLAAVLLSTSSAMSIGSVARETRSTSRRAPSSRTTKASGPRPLDRLAVLVDGADEERALASVGLRGDGAASNASERTAHTRPRQDRGRAGANAHRRVRGAALVRAV